MALRVSSFSAFHAPQCHALYSSSSSYSSPNFSRYRIIRAAPLADHSLAITCNSSSSSSSTHAIGSAPSRFPASSLRPSNVPVQKAPLLCPTPATPPSHMKKKTAPSDKKPAEGDWNSFMLFNRGLDSVKSVDKDTFWPTLEAAGDKLVVLDLYTRWCGPCRMIYPKLVKLSGQYDDVVFLKLDCTSENKYLFSKMGVGILPTFKIFKNNSLVTEVKGAKYDELVRQIEKARITDSVNLHPADA